MPNPAVEASPSDRPDLTTKIHWESLPRLAVLVGPAGIGKTRASLDYFARLLKESKNPFANDILYLLPSAEHRERITDLILRKERSGFFGERVTTFDHLMQEFLKAEDFSFATDVGRKFLLTEIVAEKGTEYFARVKEMPGFLQKMSDFVGELKESLVSVEEFREKVTKLRALHPETAAKYEELIQIYESHEARLEELGLRDHRDRIFLLQEQSKERVKSQRSRVKMSPAPRPSSFVPRFRQLFVDGFFDFSKSQYEFLRWLSKRSTRVVLTLTLDSNAERKGLFEIPLQTLAELEKLGFTPIFLTEPTNHRSASPALRHVERNLFGPPRRDGGAVDDSLLILEATGIQGEIEMIAREIRRLVRSREPRLHFSDIAVILRRIGTYEGILRAVFCDYKIPFEMHEREKLCDAPPARTLASFFRILLEDWKREDLFNFLKSAYVAKDYDRVCSLQMRALDLGILSSRERWLEEMDEPLFKKIAEFQDRFQKAETVEEWIRLTEEIIRSFGLSEIPVVYQASARRDFAALKRIQNLLEEIRFAHRAHGTRLSGFESFAKELLGLIEVDLFSLHERDKNRVQIYDVSLARQKEYKVVFLAGLLEKQFPVEVREDPILSDEERRVVGLAERLPRQALERYLFYLGITRAREKVILSYARFDLEGHEALPSFYVEEVSSLFDSPFPKKSYPVNQVLPRLEEVVEERELEAHVVYRLHERARAKDFRERVLTLALYNRLIERESFRKLLPRILFEPVASIENPAVREAFLPKGEIFKPTGLEIYGRCPYRYFASQILGLEEREEGIDARQVGELLHRVLEIYWRERVEKKTEELGNLEQAKAFVKETLRGLLEKEPLSGERAYRIELKKAQMEEWLARMVEKEIEEGSPLEPFHPRYFEFQFGFNPREADYLRLIDPYHEDLLLRGKIDRIDIDPSGRYALVIDYKTGASFQRQDLEFGTALQLPLYLLAVQQLLKLKPAGGEIYQINVAESKGFYAREALDEAGGQTKSRSVFEKKEFDKILQRTVSFSRKFAEGIKQAEIPVRPRDCDSRCPFPSLCRIEKWRLPFIYQEIREEDKKQATVVVRV